MIKLLFLEKFVYKPIINKLKKNRLKFKEIYKWCGVLKVFFYTTPFILWYFRLCTKMK